MLECPVGETPPSGDTEFWEPKALELLALLEQKGPLSLRAVKAAMTRRGFKVGTTLNLIAYLGLTDRVHYSREEKLWSASKT